MMKLIIFMAIVYFVLKIRSKVYAEADRIEYSLKDVEVLDIAAIQIDKNLRDLYSVFNKMDKKRIEKMYRDEASISNMDIIDMITDGLVYSTDTLGGQKLSSLDLRIDYILLDRDKIQEGEEFSHIVNKTREGRYLLGFTRKGVEILYVKPMRKYFVRHIDILSNEEIFVQEDFIEDGVRLTASPIQLGNYRFKKGILSKNINRDGVEYKLYYKKI